MLNQETKRRIDAARDILVGKVPDPKAQVEQITTALIYKFMDDMDQESLDLGGTASFFVQEYEKYAMNNFVGYDISPDMVRLSLVNMYLHSFPNPNTHEYDTLTSEERWDETYDVIMANPPFMSPTGGIRPHKRFSIQAKRSEVLFVDYIAEHLNTFGRAGIIVPEGIIFQSGTVYKALRKMLVEKYLYAVVSLPAGIFQPYSGVKTSILFMDRNLAKVSDSILFLKVQKAAH